MGAGGQGARDGGRSRSALLRRAATIAHKDLGDLDQAFTWLGDALIAHVDAPSLEGLDELASEVGDPRRAEETITRALAEVFDGPLVRQLLAHRAKIRREQTNDKPGAAADLRKLHDLSPSDQAIMDDLSSLLMELGDYRSMVHVYEDQLLRGKDTTARSELARKVARMWEEQLEDPREAADAWRRVLRMKPADAEATAGLERAKSTMLKKPDPGAADAYSPPKLGPPVTVMPPPPRSPSAKAPESRPELAKEPPAKEGESAVAFNAKPEEVPTQLIQPQEGPENGATPISGVAEHLDLSEAAASDREGRDSEAPPDAAADAESISFSFADAAPAFSQITTVTPLPSADEPPASDPLDEESSAVDPEGLTPTAVGSRPFLPEPPPSSPEDEGEILVIDDIAEELKELEGAAAAPAANSKEDHHGSEDPVRASSGPPPLPRP
jgi:tetratricopeptide (TPR) repeat protein